MSRAVQAPHVFFVGNQPEFSAKVIQGGHGYEDCMYTAPVAYSPRQV